MRKPMLQVNGLTAGYGDTAILRQLSISIDEGEIVGIIGPNGSGKSTLIKSICGLTRVFNGQVLFKESDITRMRPHRIARLGIGYVPQRSSIFPDMTVLENLEMGAFIRNDRPHIRSDIERSFEMFKILGKRKKQIAGTLSGGEQQMLAIARVLLARPKLLMLDEPTAGLSAKMTDEVFREIQRIRERGVTIVIVEQKVKNVLEVTERACILVTGQISLDKNSDELLADPNLGKIFMGISLGHTTD